MHDAVHDVFHVDEVAHLTAVAVAEAPFKEFDLAFFLKLEVLMEGDGSHAALVLFVRTVDVEETHAGRGGGKRCHAAAEHLVKEVLGVTVAVQGAFVIDVFHENGACAVGGCG